MKAYEKPGGCQDQIDKCLSLAARFDPNMYGNATSVNEACFDTSTNCQAEVEGPYILKSKRGYYDIGHCNWVVGERVSLGVQYESSTAFQAAGYANITHGSDIWGQVRQHGNFSFSVSTSPVI